MKDKPLESIKTRKLKTEDLPEIARIQESITKTRVSPKRIAAWRSHIQKEGSLSFVALDKKKVVGFVIGEILTNSFGLDQSGWIETLGVDPKYMGMGIGKTLGTRLFEAYKKKKVREIYTAVLWDSVDMLSFFKSMGFDRSNFINLYKKLEQK